LKKSRALFQFEKAFWLMLKHSTRSLYILNLQLMVALNFQKLIDQ
jgi:hypothetical protein